MYTEEYLLNKLKELWSKYGKINQKLIDNEEGFPTRKCFIRVFGSLENAYKIIGYNDYKKHKFTIEEAQRIVDERNGYFKILEFNGMRNKSLVQCKKCGDIFKVVLDNLPKDLSNKTNLYFGCKNCNRNKIINKLKDNNLNYIEYLGSGKYKVECLKCKNIIIGYASNLINKKYNCKYCGTNTKYNNIFNNKELYEKSTIDRINFIKHLENILKEDSLMWFYCLGVLLSDGHFDKSTKRITLWLNEKDWDIVKNISDFLHCKLLRRNNCVGIDFCSDYIFDDIVNKYDIDNKKTYNPSNISELNEEKIIAFIIGFIDGDGCMLQRKDNGHCKINIKLHVNWKDNLQYLSKCLYQYFGIENYPKVIEVKQKDKLYASITWGNQNVIYGLANFILKNNISVSSRKWNRVLKELEKR